MAVESLVLCHFGFEYSQLAVGLWILSCEETIQLVYGTLVGLLRCLLLPDIQWNLANPNLSNPESCLNRTWLSLLLINDGQ